MTRRTGHKGPGRDSTSAKVIATAERHAKWLQRRKEGWTYRRIAEESGVALSTVEEAVEKQLLAIRREPAQALFALQLEALDDLIDKALVDVDDAVQRIELVRKLRADQRKMLGLDAPTKTMDVTPPREELWARVRLWLADPSPELVQVLGEAGWRRG